MRLSKKQVFSWLLVLIFGFLSLGALSGPILPAKAQTASGYDLNQQTGMTEVGQVFGNQKTDIRSIAMNIISIVLSCLALIFLILVIVAGFRYMTSAGNEEKARGAMKQLTQAIIGLVIILLALAITKFVTIAISGAIQNKVNPLYPY